jgi:hypothetical protein
MRGPLTVLFCLAIGLAAAGADEAKQLAIPQARVVSLKFDRLTTGQALGELARQSGISVEDRLAASAGVFSLDLPNKSFWQAFDAIARAAHGRVDLYQRDGRLALVRRPEKHVDPPTSYSGLFRTALRRIASARELDTGVTTCTATLEVAWEPNLEPLLLETSPRGLIVRDDHGRALPARDEGSVMAPVDGRLALAFDVPLPCVPPASTRFDLIEGKLVAIAPSKMLGFSFGALDRLAELPADSPQRRQSQNGVTCRLSKIQLASGDRWTLQVTLDYPARGVHLESYQSRVVNNELLLESKDGSKQLKPNGYVVETVTDRRAVISYHFFETDKIARGRPADWIVRYRTPAAFVEVPLTFSFKDVPLP